MPNVLPTVEDALLVHDVAHELRSQTLHNVAERLLVLQDLEHVNSDSILDDTSESWSLPAMIRVDDEAAAVVGQDMIVGCDEAAEAMSNVIKQVVRHSPHYRHGKRVPAYELWLVRKESPETVTPEQTVEVGKSFHMVGWLRKSGAYQFPVEAIWLEGETQKFFQVHKQGDDIDIYDHEGKYVYGMAEVVDAFLSCQAESAVWIVMQDGEQYKVVDLLTCNGMDCTKLTLWDRVKMFGQSGIPDGMVSTAHTIRNADELAPLPEGSYFVRYQQEKLADLVRPFWFKHEAGAVKVGTPLPWLKPASEEVVQKTPADKLVAPVFNGPMVQLHKDHRGVSLFMEDGAKNKIGAFPQVETAVDGAAHSFIIECGLECSQNGEPLEADAFYQVKDFSDYDVVLHAYDVGLWDGKNVTGLPMTERLELLDMALDEIGSEMVRFAFDTAVTEGEALAWNDDSVRPVNTTVNDGCVWLHVG